MLAVAATESWKPTDQTSAGSITSSTRTAPARIDPVLLGRPSRMPVSASPAITPARITDGSAPVSTTKNATVPSPRANRGQRDSRSAAPSATIGASTIATLPPETTSRCERPVARKSRSSTGSSLESSPSASPISRPASRGGRDDPIERPTTERNDWAHRTGAKAAGPSRSISSTSSSAAMPRRSRNNAKPPSSTGRTNPETRTRSPRTARGASSRPDNQTVSRTLAAPSSHRTERTSSTADHRSRSVEGSTRSDPSTVTEPEMRATSASRTRCSCTLPQPTASSSAPTRAASRQSQAGRRASVGGGATAARGSRAAGAISPARSSDPFSMRRSGAIATATSNRAPPPESHAQGSANRPTSGWSSRPAQNTAASAGVIQALTP